MRVPKPRYSKEEFARRGDEIYDQEIGPHIGPDDEGKFVVIDIETGAYEIDHDDWLHPTGFCPAYLTRRCGRCVSGPDMLDALDLGTGRAMYDNRPYQCVPRGRHLSECGGSRRPET